MLLRLRAFTFPCVVGVVAVAGACGSEPRAELGGADAGTLGNADGAGEAERDASEAKGERATDSGPLDPALSLVWVKTFTGPDNQGVATPFAVGEDLWVQTEISYPTVFGAGEANEITLDAETVSVAHAWMSSSGSLVRVERSSRRTGGTINGATHSGPVAVLENGDRLVTAGVIGNREFAPGQTNATTINVPASPNGLVVSSRWATVGRYDANGTLAWMHQITGKTVFPLAIDASEDGAYLMTASFDESIDLGGAAFAAPSGQRPSVIASFANDGSLSWARQVQGTSTLYGVASDKRSRALFVTGTFGGTAVFGAGEANETKITSKALANGYWGGLVARYESNGTLAWVKVIGDDIVTSSIARVSDGVVVSGYFAKATTIGGTMRTPLGERDAFLLKLDEAGAPVWFLQIGGANDDIVDSVKLDPLGRIWAVGSTNSPAVSVDSQSFAVGSTDVTFAAVVDPSGALRRFAPLASNAVAPTMAFHPSGAVTVSGQALPGAIIGGKSIAVQGVADTFIARFAP